MTKRILVGLFLAAFGIAMTNVSFASSGDVMCTKEYKPVCGYVQVQCVRAPCYPVPQTFGNRCEAGAADATNITEGACATNERYNKLQDTSWNLQSFDSLVATGPTLSFAAEKVSAKICNSMNGSYTVDGNTIHVGAMMSTLMFCEGKLGTYESAFDLSGAKYELSTDGANHLMITTVGGHTFQWQKQGATGGKPTNTVSWKRYGLVVWQLNQIARAKGYTTVEQKQALAMDVLEKINYIMMTSIMTPLQNLKMVQLKAGVQFYYDHIGDTDTTMANF